MGLWNQMFKSIVESNAGRIRLQSNMWAIVGSRWDKKRIQNKYIAGKAGSNELGEIIHGEHVLVRRLNTSNCPFPPGMYFYIGPNGKASVPATECRKCEYYRGADRQLRFPRCTFKRSASEAVSKSVKDVQEIVDSAIDKANKIFGQ